MKSADDIINLTSITQNPLRPTNLRQDLEGTAGSIALLQIYALQALQQSVLNPALFDAGLRGQLAGIAQHQAVVRR
ncbi:MAG TPA: hypothetical protein VHH53_05220, partial [Pseudonocardiaceae bacterium]|nr:hypothetical protein [Pseudonocardiaceae bacterium]